MVDTQSQQTLSPDAEPRGAPRYCPECGERLVEPQLVDESLSRTAIWRRHRRSHYGWGESDEVDPETYLLHSDEYLDDGDEHRLKMAADEEVRDYTVEFHDKYVERVSVEANSKSEAKDLAEEERTYDGELSHTIHTDVTSTSDPKVPSVEYLEQMGLVPKSIRESDLSDDEIRAFIGTIREVGL